MPTQHQIDEARAEQQRQREAAIAEGKVKTIPYEDREAFIRNVNAIAADEVVVLPRKD